MISDQEVLNVSVISIKKDSKLEVTEDETVLTLINTIKELIAHPEIQLLEDRARQAFYRYIKKYLYSISHNYRSKIKWK